MIRHQDIFTFLKGEARKAIQASVEQGLFEYPLHPYKLEREVEYFTKWAIIRLIGLVKKTKDNSFYFFIPETDGCRDYLLVNYYAAKKLITFQAMVGHASTPASILVVPLHTPPDMPGVTFQEIRFVTN